MSTPTTLELLADWTLSVETGQIPRRIRELCKAQLLSVLAATASGRLTEDGEAAMLAQRHFGNTSGNVPLLGGGQVGVLDAIDLHTTWSMAQDYDDYMFMGHTGHSAAWTTLIIGSRQDVDADEMLACMAVANELGGRLGASLLFGPHNGQMWTPIHRLIGAAVTARLLGCDHGQTVNAMAIAMYDANDAVFRGFMGFGSKLRSAASATVAGVQAALLAAHGLDGPADILEHPQGFWSRFTYIPIKGTFRGLGTSWATDTLAVKPYPGCAYVDTTVTALLECMRSFHSQTQRPLTPDDIQEIHVDAGALTAGMDALSRGAVAEGRLSPVVVNFSIPLTVAATIAFDGLRGSDITTAKLNLHRETLRGLAQKTTLRHNAHYSIAMVKAFDSAIPIYNWVRGIPLRKLYSLRKRAKADMGDHVDGAVFAKGVGKTLTRQDRRYLLGFLWRTAKNAITANWKRKPYHGLALDEIDFRALRMLFPARIRIELNDGTTLSAECFDPPGVAYDGSIHKVARDKWIREGGRILGATVAAQFADDIYADRLNPQGILAGLQTTAASAAIPSPL